jgi:hypothetical protein
VDYLESIAPEMMQPACTMLEWYYIKYHAPMDRATS